MHFKTTNMENKPFVFGVETSEEHFTDREKETARLIQNFQNGINTILISPRRWGKTSLVHKVCNMVESEHIRTVRLDIFSCRSEKDFYDAFATAVLKQTSSRIEEWLENIRLFLSRISPRITMGPDPMSDFSISLEYNPKPQDVDDILQLPERIAQKRGYSIVVCIDEFQQIGEFRDSLTFQKRLRSVWQLQKSVSYCLFGSKKHMMSGLFENSSKPFYKFGDILFLQKIDTEAWKEYICSRFIATGKKISPELAENICRKVDNHSSYVQQYAWLVWIHTDKEACTDDLNSAYLDLLDQNTPLFEKQTENLTTYQMNFLRAIVNGTHSEFSSREIIERYQLGSSANVSIIRKSLIDKELIDISRNQVHIPDPVMEEWLRREFKR